MTWLRAEERGSPVFSAVSTQSGATVKLSCGVTEYYRFSLLLPDKWDGNWLPWIKVSSFTGCS